MDVVLPEAWTRVLETLDGSIGSTMLLGPPDSGKTSLCFGLVQRWTAAGQKVALLDCDLGQSEVGPPGSIGLAYAAGTFERFSDLSEPQLEFVGVTSPDRNPAQFLAAAAILWNRAGSYNRAIIDTDGHVFGPGARIQKLELVRLLEPARVVAIQRGDEMEPLLDLLEQSTKVDIIRLGRSEHAVLRSPELRARRRQAKWLRYFRESREHVLSLDEVRFAGCRLGSGRALDVILRDRMSRVLRTKVLHAEALPGSLWAVTEEPVAEEVLLRAQEALQVQRVTYSLSGDYRGLLCGLAGPEGYTLGLGILLNVDFTTRRARVLSPVRATQSVARLTLGLQKIGSDFRDLGTVRPSLV